MKILEKNKTGNIIGIIGLLIAFLALFPTWYPKIVSPKKELFIGNQYTVPLLKQNTLLKDRVGIKIEDKDIENIYITSIKIKNTGTKTITASDYSDQLIFRAENADFIGAEISEYYRDKFEVQINVNKTEVIISPIMLNPEEAIYINIYSLVENSKLITKLRISEGNVVSREKESKLNLPLFFLVLFIQIFMLPFEQKLYLNRSDRIIITKHYSKIVLAILFIAKYGTAYIFAIISVGKEDSLLFWSSTMVFINLIGLVINMLLGYLKMKKELNIS